MNDVQLDDIGIERQTLLRNRENLKNNGGTAAQIRTYDRLLEQNHIKSTKLGEKITVVEKRIAVSKDIIRRLEHPVPNTQIP